MLQDGIFVCWFLLFVMDFRRVKKKSSGCLWEKVKAAMSRKSILRRLIDNYWPEKEDNEGTTSRKSPMELRIFDENFSISRLARFIVR